MNAHNVLWLMSFRGEIVIYALFLQIFLVFSIKKSDIDMKDKRLTKLYRSHNESQSSNFLVMHEDAHLSYKRFKVKKSCLKGHPKVQILGPSTGWVYAQPGTDPLELGEWLNDSPPTIDNLGSSWIGLWWTTVGSVGLGLSLNHRIFIGLSSKSPHQAWIWMKITGSK